MLTSGVIITIIICATLVAMSVINAIAKAHDRKIVNRSIDKFSKAFPKFETPEKKDEDRDDFFKTF